jgi:hypothetical protein
MHNIGCNPILFLSPKQQVLLINCDWTRWLLRRESGEGDQGMEKGRKKKKRSLSSEYVDLGWGLERNSGFQPGSASFILLDDSAEKSPHKSLSVVPQAGDWHLPIIFPLCSWHMYLCQTQRWPGTSKHSVCVCTCAFSCPLPPLAFLI